MYYYGILLYCEEAARRQTQETPRFYFKCKPRTSHPGHEFELLRCRILLFYLYSRCLDSRPPTRRHSMQPSLSSSEFSHALLLFDRDTALLRFVCSVDYFLHVSLAASHVVRIMYLLSQKDLYPDKTGSAPFASNVIASEVCFIRHFLLWNIYCCSLRPTRIPFGSLNALVS